jgi:hypothetical protein
VAEGQGGEEKQTWGDEGATSGHQAQSSYAQQMHLHVSGAARKLPARKLVDTH